MKSINESGALFLAGLIAFSSVEGCVSAAPAEDPLDTTSNNSTFAPERSLAHGQLSSILSCDQLTAVGVECDMAFIERQSESKMQIVVLDGEECGRESNTCRSGHAVGTRMEVNASVAPNGGRAINGVLYHSAVVRGRRIEQASGRASVRLQRTARR